MSTALPAQDHEALLPPEAVVQAPELAPALAAWRERLAAAGAACLGVALHSDQAAWCAGFEPAAWAATWAELRERVDRANPVALARLDQAQALMVGMRLSLPDGQPGTVGVVLAPPHNDRSLQQLLLALGWLQLQLSAASLAHNQRAAELLALLGQVSSQAEARAAAQDWINRSAAWARAQQDEESGYSLLLFEAQGERLRWWVSADAAQAETGAPALQQALELAQQARVQGREIERTEGWALPLLEQGEVVAVLVALGSPPTEPARLVLRSSALLAEPLLRHWREAGRGWFGHTLAALQRLRRRLLGPGFWTWKVGGIGSLLLWLLLVAWPVADRVTANLVIEGQTRHLLSAPFEGFVDEALVRPGDRVQRGQALLRLDTRELRLEQARLQGERDQAAGRLRQAMVDREAGAVALASAELQAAQGELAQVEAKLARAELRAPIDGLVISGDWSQQRGAPVQLGKELFELADESGYRVVLQVDERDIARVRAGQQGLLRLAGQPHQAYGLQLSRITATASVQDGANGFRVEAQWQGEAPRLSPGQQGVAKIEVGQSNLLTIWTRRSLDWLRLKLWTWWW